MHTSTAKQSLSKRLATLLAISHDDDPEYVMDILDQLIEMGDNPEDVVVYLSSFVVDDNSSSSSSNGGDDPLEQFAKDIKKFQSGEFIDLTGNNSTGNGDITDQRKKEASTLDPPPAARILDEFAAQREEIKLREKEAREKQREEQERFRKKKKEEEDLLLARNRNKMKQQPESQWGKKKQPVPGQGKTGGSVATSGRNNQKSKQTPTIHTGQNKSTTHPATAMKQSTNKNSNLKNNKHNNNSTSGAATTNNKPPKGTPTKICGCYGNKHKPLTNCLHCGRISCSYEGYDYCPHCNNLILDYYSSTTTANDGNLDSAMAHKERLLEFDRTSAARTQIHDDQEDYFVTSTSMWSTNEEQVDAQELEEERRRKMHEREKQVLNINF